MDAVDSKTKSWESSLLPPGCLERLSFQDLVGRGKPPHDSERVNRQFSWPERSLVTMVDTHHSRQAPAFVRAVFIGLRVDGQAVTALVRATGATGSSHGEQCGLRTAMRGWTARRSCPACGSGR